ncbi:MAG: hypothetical protein FWD47_14585 [Treponema sp.]|nr:hypothetical protein [Treponema sp.]
MIFSIHPMQQNTVRVLGILSMYCKLRSYTLLPRSALLPPRTRRRDANTEIHQFTNAGKTLSLQSAQNTEISLVG